MPSKSTHPGPMSPTRIRNVQSKHHDVYDLEAKPAGSLVCDECRAIYHKGRWSWRAPVSGELHAGTCPACRRIHDRYPAGTLRVPKAMLSSRDEIVGLISNAADAERDEHPLERIISIDEDDQNLIVTTTGTHLARRIASCLRRHLHEKPKVHYGEDNDLRMDWIR